MSPPPGRPKEGSLPPGGKARSAKGAHICPPPGRPKEGSLPPGGKARSAKGAPTVKILVIKRDKIGDLLLTTPLFTVLKRSLPDARIHVLANDYNAWVVADNPNVERVWIYRRTRHAGSLRVSAVLEQVRQ